VHERRREQVACCCAHGHLPGCEFQLLQEEVGVRAAHEQLHMPSPNACSCKEQWMNNHTKRCRYALEFLSSHNAHYRGWGAEEFVHFESLHICCCLRVDREHYKPHDESMKFKLLVNPRQGLQGLALETGPGICEDETSPLVSEAINHSSNTVLLGRNLLLTQIVRLAKDTPFLFVVGSEGSGRTQLIRRAAGYLTERGCFTSGAVYLDLFSTSHVNAFISKIAEPLEITELGNLRKNREKELLFLLDDFDSLLNAQAIDILLRVSTDLPQCRFIVTLKKSSLVNLKKEYLGRSF
jgi:hypothetical protein